MNNRGWILALLGVAVASVAVLLLWEGEPEEATRPSVGASRNPPATVAQLAELRAQLEAERAARLELADEIESLRDEWIALAGVADAADPLDDEEGLDLEGEGAPVESPARGRFDEAALVEGGLSGSEVRWLRDRYDAYQLDRLYLRDQGAREGWFGTGRLREERAALIDDLRQEVGLEMYDWMLYASGQPNRVLVREVISRSAADRAGLEAGDVVVRYADRPVYDVRELRRMTTEGEYGEQVFVEVERGGSRLRLEVPRGPLGVRLRPERTPPPAP